MYETPWVTAQGRWECSRCNRRISKDKSLSLMLFWDAATIEVWSEELPDGYLSFPMSQNSKIQAWSPGALSDADHHLQRSDGHWWYLCETTEQINRFCTETVLWMRSDSLLIIWQMVHGLALGLTCTVINYHCIFSFSSSNSLIKIVTQHCTESFLESQQQLHVLFSHDGTLWRTNDITIHRWHKL